MSDYFAAIWPHWVSLMGCAAFTFVSIIADVAKKTPRWVTWVTAGLAVFFIFVASYQAWNDEHVARLGAESKLTSLTVPNFELQYSSLRIGDSKNENGRGDVRTTVFVTLSVLNHGAPSAVTNWMMVAKLGDGREFSGRPWLPHREIIFTVNGQDMSFTTNQSLFKTASSSPIPTGGIAGGFVLFQFTDVSKSELEDHKTVVTMLVEDSLHHLSELSIPIRVEAGPQDMKIPPGMPLN